MATIIEEAEVLELGDFKVELRPLKIKKLRQFMKKFDGLSEVAESNDDSIALLMECAAIAMEQFEPKLADVEKLEEEIDLPELYKIIEVASGIKLGDSGNRQAAMEAGMI